jgi:hypothetical protein
LLTKLDYALHINAKKIEARASHPERKAQFAYIAQQRQAFTAAGQPIISVDTKKKELIGAFKNNGRAWSQEAEAVNVHDFLSEAQGRAVPYGVCDVTHQRGTVYVGSAGDTAQFAVDAIAQWWQTQGQGRCGDHPRYDLRSEALGQIRMLPMAAIRTAADCEPIPGTEARMRPSRLVATICST